MCDEWYTHAHHAKIRKMKKKINLVIKSDKFFNSESETSWGLYYYTSPLFKSLQMYIEDFDTNNPKYFIASGLKVSEPEIRKDNTTIQSLELSLRAATKKEIKNFKMWHKKNGKK
jgi:hypothetical protein